jgi:putative ABC transport system permease protein
MSVAVLTPPAPTKPRQGDSDTATYELLATPPPTGGGGLRLLQTIPSALQALQANKGRSLLTALGIIIGVAAVIAVVALGQGSQASVTSQLQGLGTDQITISPGSTRTGGVSGGAGSVSTLTSSDADGLIADVAGIKAVSPTVQTSVQVIAGNKNWSTRVTGVTSSYQEIQSWQMAQGAFFTDQDNQTARSVAVIGQTVLTNLFADPSSAIGQTIQVRNVPFTIVGVLAAKGSSVGGDQDDTILVPLQTAQIRLLGTKTVNSIIVQASDASQLTALQTAVEEEMRVLHKLNAKADDFSIRNNADLVSRVGSVSQTLTLLLGSVAFISLIVGGVGIMNIMLVSVTERTREIGIRLAIGAQPGDIQAQFMVEALILSLLGGLIGITIGDGLALLLPRFGWATSLSPEAGLAAFGFSALIGVFFGFYPAQKASRLDPIEALRYQ